MLDHILEIIGIAVFGVKCLSCDTTELCLRNNPTWNKEDIEVVI